MGKSVEYFYEAGSCQAPFFVIGYMSSSLLFVVDRTGGFQIQEAVGLPRTIFYPNGPRAILTDMFKMGQF
jgi:hypothetical protein